MPARTPLEALIEDLGRASGAEVTVSDHGDHMRVSVTAPAEAEAYEAVLNILLDAAAWGSSDATGELRLWGSVPKGPRP